MLSKCCAENISLVKLAVYTGRHATEVGILMKNRRCGAAIIVENLANLSFFRQNIDLWLFILYNES